MRTDKHWKDIFSQILLDADVIFEILDARNPLGTRNEMLEDFLARNAPEKKLFLVLNKIDLIPRHVLEQWIQYFEQTSDNIEHPVFGVSARYNRNIIAFKTNLKKILSRGDYKAIIVGYPNTGKSSLIQALAEDRKQVSISSKAGHTRGVTEFKIGGGLRLYDSPGVIPLSEKDEVDQALKAVITPEKVEDKELVVYRLIELFITPQKILEHYDIDKDFILEVLEQREGEKFIQKYLPEKSQPLDGYKSSKIRIASSLHRKAHHETNLQYSDFEKIIELLGRKREMLKKGNEVDLNRVYVTIIHEWQKNQIKFYILPPENC